MSSRDSSFRPQGQLSRANEESENNIWEEVQPGGQPKSSQSLVKVH